MNVKKECKKLVSYAKKIHNKSIIHKINKIEDDIERFEVLCYSMKSKLDIDYYYLEKEIKKIEGKYDNLHLFVKMRLLKSKIKLFEATYSKKDFINVIKLFKEIKRELKNVRVI